MTIKDIVLIALFTALTVALGLFPKVPVPFIPVPVVMQHLGFMLAGALLGAKRGFIVVLVFWILTASGMPVLTGGIGGLPMFYGPTAGYIWGWGLMTLFIGFCYGHMHRPYRAWQEIVVLTLGVTVVLYSCGILGLTLYGSGNLNLLVKSNLVFIPGDLLKVAIVYAVTRVIRKALPGII